MMMVWRMFACTLLVSIATTLGSPTVEAELFEGDACSVDGLAGLCTSIHHCEEARTALKNGVKPKICLFEKELPIVCCHSVNPVPSNTDAQEPHWSGQKPAQKPAQWFGQQPAQEQWPGQQPAQEQYPEQQPVPEQYPEQQHVQEQYPELQPAQEQYPELQPAQEQYPELQPAQEQYPEQQHVQEQWPGQQTTQQPQWSGQQTSQEPPLPYQEHTQPPWHAQENPQESWPAQQSAQEPWSGQEPTQAQHLHELEVRITHKPHEILPGTTTEGSKKKRTEWWQIPKKTTPSF